jgi:L-malate glycosyltransferase
LGLVRPTVPETVGVQRHEQGCGLRAKCVFVWENLGPMHEDRLAAVNQRWPGQVAAIQFSPASQTYAWEGAREHAVPTTTLRRQEEVGCLTLAWRLFKASRQSGAGDIFMCHYERVPVLLASVLLRLTGRRVFTMFDSKFDDFPRRSWREALKRLFFLPYNGAIYASRRSGDYLRFLGFVRRPLVPGYDTLSVARIRAQCPDPPAPGGVPHANRDFLIVARLVPKKNIALALDAYAAWRSDAGDSKRQLRILGSGELESELRAQAQRLGIADRVIFEGFVQTDRVSWALGRALCLILPSIEEQFGLVVIEAMAMGVPALVSINAGAVDLMIDNGVNGWIVDPGSPVALIAAMTRLDRDPEGWAAMAQSACEDAMRGDASHFADAVAALIGSGKKAPTA